MRDKIKTGKADTVEFKCLRLLKCSAHYCNKTVYLFIGTRNTVCSTSGGRVGWG